MIFIAHRGESILETENTLASVTRAWKNGVTAVEVDVHLTRDKQVVAFHDANTKKLSGENLIISQSTYDQLSQLLLSGPSKPPGQIPLLRDLIETIPEEGKLIIEIKTGPEINDHLLALLLESGVHFDQIEIISFNFHTLTNLRSKLPDSTKILLLLELDYYFPNWLIWRRKDHWLRKVREYGFDGVNVWAGKLLTRDFIDFWHQEGMLVYAWTVNDLRKAQNLQEWGLDGLTTDKAGWMKQQFKSKDV